MKKLLFTLSIALCTSFFAQAQIGTAGFKTVKNASNYYIGSVLSGKSYTEDFSTNFLADVIYKPELSTSVANTYSLPDTQPGLKALQDYIASFRDKISSSGNASFTFSSLAPIGKDPAQLDKLLSTKDAAKKLFNEPNLFSKYKVYYSSASIVWFTIDSDFPDDGKYVSDEELKKIASLDPIAVLSVAYGRTASIIVASNQEEDQLKKAFKIFQNEDQSQYELANSILQDSFMSVVVVGNTPLDTTGLNPQQIIEKYLEYMRSPIEDKELLSPISFTGVHINDNSLF